MWLQLNLEPSEFLVGALQLERSPCHREVSVSRQHQEQGRKGSDVKIGVRGIIGVEKLWLWRHLGAYLTKHIEFMLPPSIASKIILGLIDRK